MVKERNIALCIILSIVTCGIYAFYWLACITDDINELSGDNSTSGILSVVLTIVTCGIYGIYWAYKMGDQLDHIKESKESISQNSGILYLILYILCNIIAFALLQNEINKLAV